MRLDRKIRFTIQKTSDDPANSLCELYGEKRNLPFCKIYEDDFCETLTEKQFSQFKKGQNKFIVSENLLIDRSKKWFNQNI